MSGLEYLEEVMINAIQKSTAPQTHQQQIIAEYMIGEMDGTAPGGVERIIQQELGRRVTTPRHNAQAKYLR